MTLMTPTRIASILFVLAATLPVYACGGATADTETTAEGADGEQYAIRIHRPFVDGQLLAIEVDAHQIIEATIEGNEEEVAGITEELRCHLEAQVTFHETTEDGRAAHATLLINNFSDPEGGAAIIEAGTSIDVSRDGDDMVLSVEDGALTEDQAALLLLAIPLERPGSRLGDELFGTDEPQAVNDSWQLNREYLVQDLADDGLHVTETNVTGETRLESVSACGDGQCLHLVANISAAQGIMAELADAAEFEEGQINAIVRLEVPVDDSSPVVSEEATVTGQFTARFESEEVTVVRNLSFSRMRHARYTLITE